ncbi:hypothetical protein ACLX1H_008030 [Fusarium chlamydosporum]
MSAAGANAANMPNAGIPREDLPPADLPLNLPSWEDGGDVYDDVRCLYERQARLYRAGLDRDKKIKALESQVAALEMGVYVV